MHKITLNTFFILALVGCATSAGFEKKINQWIGRPANDLYARLGSPNFTQKLSDNTEILQYNRSRLVELAAERTELVPQQRIERQSSSYGRNILGENTRNSKSSETTLAAQTIPQKTETIWCNIRFRINKEEIIESISWEGNGCKARDK